jgi:hypothetical protein
LLIPQRRYELEDVEDFPVAEPTRLDRLNPYVYLAKYLGRVPYLC